MNRPALNEKERLCREGISCGGRLHLHLAGSADGKHGGGNCCSAIASLLLRANTYYREGDSQQVEKTEMTGKTEPEAYDEEAAFEAA